MLPFPSPRCINNTSVRYNVSPKHKETYSVELISKKLSIEDDSSDNSDEFILKLDGKEISSKGA